VRTLQSTKVKRVTHSFISLSFLFHNKA
jgi:hypothetical protein